MSLSSQCQRLALSLLVPLAKSARSSEVSLTQEVHRPKLLLDLSIQIFPLLYLGYIELVGLDMAATIESVLGFCEVLGIVVCNCDLHGMLTA